MEREYGKYKGIHPGAILERGLDKRNLAQRPFAQSLSEHLRIINAIMKGKRDQDPVLALKIRSALGLEERFVCIV